MPYPSSSLHLIVIGTGYVGLVTGVCFARLGHIVTCIDKDEQRIAALQAGTSPIYEPGLDQALHEAIRSNRLTFSEHYTSISRPHDAVLLAVGTPEDPETGAADLRYIFEALGQVAEHASSSNDLTVITKSTVPAGTAARIHDFLRECRPDIMPHVISNPEFLREGFALEDFMKPDRIICGCDDAYAEDLCRALYAPLTSQDIRLDIYGSTAAELIKYAANGFLAMKIAFINEMSDICQALGANVSEIADGIGSDSRIGPKFLQAGPGYGGSCFPKDTASLLKQSEQAGCPSRLIEAAMRSNDLRMPALLRRAQRMAPKPLNVCRVAVLGAAFKAGTDDVRESPALAFVRHAYHEGARHITITDPQALENTRRHLNDIAGPRITYADTWVDCIQGCDIAVILTEWPEFKALSPDVFLAHAAQHAVIFDTRNILDADAVRSAGITYECIGEGHLQQRAFIEGSS